MPSGRWAPGGQLGRPPFRCRMNASRSHPGVFNALAANPREIRRWPLPPERVGFELSCRHPNAKPLCVNGLYLGG
jgi:hypothetical protein